MADTIILLRENDESLAVVIPPTSQLTPFSSKASAASNDIPTILEKVTIVTSLPVGGPHEQMQRQSTRHHMAGIFRDVRGHVMQS